MAVEAAPAAVEAPVVAAVASSVVGVGSLEGAAVSAALAAT